MESPQEEIVPEERLESYPSPTHDTHDTQQEAEEYFDNDHAHKEVQQEDAPEGQHPGPHHASVEELQLAAQLGQDLASEPMMPVTDPNLKFDEPNLRTILPHPEEHDMRAVMPHSDEHLRHVLPHPDDHTPQPYQDAVPPPRPHPPLAPQVQMSLGQGMQQSFSNISNDSTPPRKRSKVSRACDECRRKKVKCDAPSDTGDTPCSNCRRSSQRCSFSRIPQKRGPSKGYIKELADRINSIEGRLGENAAPGDETSRKRDFSSISSGELQAPAGLRSSNLSWAPEPRPQTQHSTTPERPSPSYHTNGLAPQPVGPKPDTPSKPLAVGLEGGAAVDIPGLSQPRDIDETVFQGYLSIIHPYLPILPTTKSRLQVYLAQCSGMLREAFLEALAGTLQSFPGFTSSTTGDVALARKMLAEWELNDDTPHTSAAQIVHLQTLVLLLIESDVRPSASAGTQKVSLLGRAVGAAWSLRLHRTTVDLHADGDSDADSDTHIRVRLWWSLVTLDRWSAMSSGTPVIAQKQSTIAQTGLSTIVGETPWLLIRLSKIMERASAVITALQQPDGYPPFGVVIAGFVDDYVENFREDLPSHIDPLTHPVVHLTYWHCRLLAYLLDPSAKVTDVIWPCRELVALLVAVPHPTSPFHHHFQALTMLVLAELTSIDKTKNEAGKLLAEMRKLPTSSTSWDGIVADRIGDLLKQTQGGQGLLLQLADVAASSAVPESDKADETASLHSTTDYEGMGFDPRPLLTKGYFKFIWASHVQA